MPYVRKCRRAVSLLDVLPCSSEGNAVKNRIVEAVGSVMTVTVMAF